MKTILLAISVVAAVTVLSSCDSSDDFKTSKLDHCKGTDMVKQNQTETDRLEQISMCMIGNGFAHQPGCTIKNYDNISCYRGATIFSIVR